MSAIDELQQQRQEITDRLEALRALRVDYARDATAEYRPAKAVADIDKRILGAEHRLELVAADLAIAEEEEGLERVAQQVEAKRLAEIEALEHYLAWYSLSLQAEEARLLWCAARQRVPGDVNMPCMSDEACAEWAADRLVELGAEEDLPEDEDGTDLITDPAPLAGVLLTP